MENFRCNECDKNFDSQLALDMHNKSKHSEKLSKSEPFITPKLKKRIRNWLIFIIILALIFSSFYYLAKKDAEADASLDFEVPKGAIHWHPHLTIRINGIEQSISPNIGIGSVHFPIHTHEGDGTLHMENNAPTKKTVTFGYFFEVWERKFSEDCIFDYCNDKGVLKMYVNGKENFDFGNYFMQDKDEILIEYISKEN